MIGRVSPFNPSFYESSTSDSIPLVETVDRELWRAAEGNIKKRINELTHEFKGNGDKNEVLLLLEKYVKDDALRNLAENPQMYQNIFKDFLGLLLQLL